MTHVDWHPYPETKPKKEDHYLLTVEYPFLSEYKEPIDREIRIGYWACGRFFTNLHDVYHRVTAWAELPEPYRQEAKNEIHE